MSMTEKESREVRMGRALRRLRERRGLTMAEVARRLGMKASSSSQISRWEQGKCSPRSTALWRYTEAVDASLHDFVNELIPAPPGSERLQEIARELDWLAENDGRGPRDRR